MNTTSDTKQELFSIISDFKRVFYEEVDESQALLLTGNDRSEANRISRKLSYDLNAIKDRVYQLQKRWDEKYIPFKRLVDLIDSAINYVDICFETGQFHQFSSKNHNENIEQYIYRMKELTAKRHAIAYRGDTTENNLRQELLESLRINYDEI